nr:MAG TPA: hypothetical protein [Caudoviricetes sp.]
MFPHFIPPKTLYVVKQIYLITIYCVLLLSML